MQNGMKMSQSFQLLLIGMRKGGVDGVCGGEKSRDWQLALSSQKLMWKVLSYRYIVIIMQLLY